MILRSNKQTTPVLKLIITENKTKKKTEKKALKKRNQNSIYKYLKKRYKIRKNNAIIPF